MGEEEMNAWANFVQQAAGSQIIRPEWACLSDAQIAYKLRQQAEGDVHLHRIVEHLQKHGEMSTVNLAADMGWKPDATFRRCERGQRRGLLNKEVRQEVSRYKRSINVTFWSANV